MDNNVINNYISYRIKDEKVDSKLVLDSFNFIKSKIENSEDILEELSSDIELIEYIIGEIKSKETDNIEAIANNAYESFILNSAEDKPDISIYDTTLTKFLNLVSFLKKINTPIAYYKPEVSLINDLFQTVFKQLYAFATLISSKLYLQSLASWRSLHESECIIKLLIQNEKIKKEYIKHIKYNNYLRNPTAYSKSELDKYFELLKNEMHTYDLKSKDMKKFIEYGYLYFASNYKKDDVNFKLNFRDGLEYLSGLSKYSKVYEGASQIVHSSSSYFYVNENFCKDLSLTLTYQTLIRITFLYKTYMNDYFKNNSNMLNKVNELLNSVTIISSKLDKEINIDGVLNDETSF